MHNKTRYLAVVGATLAFAALSAPAHAQATRTWVSGVGDDLNPCSRTAPCKTFAGAISKTFINGEIDCLDPGGYGAVTITKSITLDCTGTFGSILTGAGNGIVINIAVGANDPFRTVRIRGLSINGTGASGTGRATRPPDFGCQKPASSSRQSSGAALNDVHSCVTRLLGRRIPAMEPGNVGSRMLHCNMKIMAVQ